MLSPPGRMSPFQAAQICIRLQDANIFTIAVRACSTTARTSSRTSRRRRVQGEAPHRRGELDQLGEDRAQAVLLFKAYFAVTRRDGEPVSFSVPLGNFGNVYAGHVARRMGLPNQEAHRRTNENDVLDEFLPHRALPRAQGGGSEGHQQPVDGHLESSNFRALTPTTSAGATRDALRGLWRSSSARGLSTCRHRLFQAGCRDRLRVRARAPTPTAWPPSPRVEDHGVMIDPPHADGVKVGLEHREAGVPLVCMETAQPAKFAETIRGGARPRSRTSRRLREPGRSFHSGWK